MLLPVLWGFVQVWGLCPFCPLCAHTSPTLRLYHLWTTKVTLCDDKPDISDCDLCHTTYPLKPDTQDKTVTTAQTATDRDEAD